MRPEVRHGIIGEWIRRLGYLLRRRALEDELRREMEAHRALLEEPRAFGNTLRLRDEARDAWGWTWLDDFVQDTRFALRTLRHSPGFALTAIVTLALGIGVNIGMFSLVNGLLLRPLYERPDEVVGVYSRSTAPSGGYRGFSYPNYLDLREGTTDIFANLAAFSTVFVGLDAGEGARRTLASAVTANYFQVFGRPLALGRPFTAEEERLGADIRVAIISYPLWERRGADPGILGRPVRVNGEPFTVVGVAPKGFTGTSIPGPEVWLPLGAHETFSTRRHVGRAPVRRARGARVGRRGAAPGRHLGGDCRAGTRHRRPSTRAGVSGGQRRLHARDVGAFASHVHARARRRRGRGDARPAADGHAGDRPARRVPQPRRSAAGPRSGAPAGMAIRSSLGGGRGRLTRQLLTEGLLLALAGGAVGLLLSTWATDALLASLRPVLPVALSLPELDLDWRVLVGTVGFSLAATLVFGAWPAWALTGRAVVDRPQATRSAKSGPAAGRRQDRQCPGHRPGRALASPARVRWTVPDERDLRRPRPIPGFVSTAGLLVEVDPGLAGYDEARGRQSHLALVDRLRAVPGVEAVTIGSAFSVHVGSATAACVAPAGAADAQSKLG